MASRKITVTSEDYRRLVEILKDRVLTAIADPNSFRELAAELERAKIVDASTVGPDVVTMNSTVKLTDLKSGETETFTLVYPKDANIAEGRLSILAPIGTAILGYRVGNRVRWSVPAGQSNMRIDEVIYQPERDTVAA
tara:strand:- start:106816 stop:107229 length:414 start_codon:yes stop_codon:yes gene_type:complete